MHRSVQPHTVRHAVIASVPFALLGATVLAEWLGRHERHILQWPIVRWWIGRAKIRRDRKDIRAFARGQLKRRSRG